MSAEAMELLEKRQIIANHVLAIEAEVHRAMGIHRGINSLHEAHSVILEEFEEFWEQVKINPKKLTESQRHERMQELRKELIQTAAMCVRSLVDLQL